MLAVLVLAGCTESEYEDPQDTISREIERIQAEAAAQGQADGTLSGNIRVDANLLTTTLSEYSSINLLWQYVDHGSAVVARPSVFAQAGLRIGVANEQFAIQLAATQKKLRAAEQTTLFLLLADGTSGRINIGTEIAIPTFHYMGKYYSGLEYGFRQAGRSLDVSARTLPDGRIELILMPVFSRFLSTGGDMELMELSTTVVVMPGQTVVLGGSSSGTQDVATALFGQRRDKRELQTLLTVTASLQ